MRAFDFTEIAAGINLDDPDDVVEYIVEATIATAAAKDLAIANLILAADGEPVASLGAWLIGTRRANVNMFATDRWTEIWRPATRFCRKIFIPKVLVPFVRRAECMAWKGHDQSRRWLRHLGFVEEGIARAYGKSGENFVYMAWLNPENAAHVL